MDFERQVYTPTEVKHLLRASKFKDAVYRIALWDNKDIIVVPPSMLAELRKLPDDVISFSEATSEVRVQLYTRESN